MSRSVTWSEFLSFGVGSILKSARASITTLLIGTAVLFLGNGLQQTLVPIRAKLEAFSTTSVGLLGAAYFAGFALGCVIGPLVLRRVGHIRCFAGFAALAASGSLAFPLAVDPITWSVLRGFTGFSLAVLYMVIASWLNEQSSNKVRGQVLALYVIVTNVVTIGGQLMLNFYDVRHPAQFTLIAIFICLSLVPLSLTPTAAPKPIAEARLRIGRLFRLSPTGFVGCFAIGIVEGSFWTLGPVFADARGFPVLEITLFMSAFVVGGTLSQWPIGKYSDRVDRRQVIVACCLGTTCTGLALAFLDFGGLAATFAVAGLHGAFMIPLYALLLAHTNDYAPTETLVETSSGLLLVYASGAVIGPLVVAPAMDQAGPGALFMAMAVVLGALALFTAYRWARRPAAAEIERVEFVPVPKTTPSVYSLEEDD